MRLIDADELITIEIDEADPPFRFVPAEFIEAAPTIDAVPVVRCEDCVHWEGKDGQCPSQTTGDPYLDQQPAADAFCSQGERKKQQGDGTLCEEGHW